jgi:hypothetical protein
MKFVQTVVNMSHITLDKFKDFAGDNDLINIDMEDLIKQVNRVNSRTLQT